MEYIFIRNIIPEGLLHPVNKFTGYQNQELICVLEFCFSKEYYKVPFTRSNLYVCLKGITHGEKGLK